MTETVAQAIATAASARRNCERLENQDLVRQWTGRLNDLADLLPSGSGIDSGTSIDLEQTTGKKLVLQTAFHHMNDAGYYDGWTHHSVQVTPTFGGNPTIYIGGRNRNGIKEYLHDTFADALSAEAPS